MQSHRIIAVCMCAFGLVSTVRSEVVYTDIPDVFLSGGASVDLDIDQDGTSDIQFWSGYQGSSATGATGVQILVVDDWYAWAVPVGELIGVADQAWASYASVAFPCKMIPYCSYLPSGAAGFLGVRLSGDSGARYGWIRASAFWDIYGATLTIYDFAYETTPDTPIAAGDVSCLEDCNQNGRCDVSDIVIGVSLDLNGNHIPDECEPVVTVRVPEDYATINEAVVAMPANASTILVAPGVYDVQVLDFNVRPLMIRGEGPRGSIVVRGDHLYAWAPVVLDNLLFEIVGIYVDTGTHILGCDFVHTYLALPSSCRMDRCRLMATASTQGVVLEVGAAVVSNSEIIRTGSHWFSPVYAEGAHFVNCTIIQMGSSSSVIYSHSPQTTVENSIVRTDGAPLFAGWLGQARHCDISGGWAGDGNIDADPLFLRNPGMGPDGLWGTADDDFGNLRLRPASPCIDAGDVSALPPDDLDFDGDGDTTEPLPFDFAGNRRVVRGSQGPRDAVSVDMGAYERQLRGGVPSQLSAVP